jgi:hypothetical protein
MKISRWWFVLVVVVAVGGAILWPRSADLLALGRAGSAEAMPRAAAPAADAAAKSADEKPAFDYFPDRYVNQAKEPAQPIDPF